MNNFITQETSPISFHGIIIYCAPLTRATPANNCPTPNSPCKPPNKFPLLSLSNPPNKFVKPSNNVPIPNPTSFRTKLNTFNMLPINRANLSLSAPAIHPNTAGTTVNLINASNNEANC